MKHTCNPKLFVSIITILSLPLITACQGTFKGLVKTSSETLPKVSITANAGYRTCSDANGEYTFEVEEGTNILIYRKKGYKLGSRTEYVGLFQTKTLSDTTLNPSTTGKEIKGNIGASKPGVKVRLYQLQCGSYTEIDSMFTCSDGDYSFSGRPDGTDLPDGTYKVTVECSVCTWNSTSIENITITNSSQYDFTGAACGAGDCIWP